jgi:hypothetical protein
VAGTEIVAVSVDAVGRSGDCQGSERTTNQVQREDALRRVFASAGLAPYGTRGSDASRFLDCDVPRDIVGAAILLQRIFESLFGIDSSTELRFIGNGLHPRPNSG